MSDLACWKLGEAEVVVRVYGCEMRMTRDEAYELIEHVERVLNGRDESLGEGYEELEVAIPPVRIDFAQVLRRLGVVPQEIPRRKF